MPTSFEFSNEMKLMYNSLSTLKGRLKLCRFLSFFPLRSFPILSIKTKGAPPWDALSLAIGIDQSFYSTLGSRMKRRGIGSGQRRDAPLSRAHQHFQPIDRRGEHLANPFVESKMGIWVKECFPLIDDDEPCT